MLATAALIFVLQAFISRYLFWDSYYALVAGRHIAAHGIPSVEVLTTASKPGWIDQPWLAHWLFYQAWSIGGYVALASFSAILVTLGFTLLAGLMVSRGVPGPRAFFWALAAFGVALGGTVVRAQSFSLALAVIVLWVILDDSDSPRFRARFLLVVPVLAVWANLHGSVALWAAAVVAYCIGRATLQLMRGRWRSGIPYAFTSVAAGLAVLATPYGAHVIDYYVEVLGNSSVRQYIAEWAAPALGSPYSVAFFVMLGATSLIVLYGLVRGNRPPALLLAGAIGLAVLALTGVRFQVWFGIVASVLAADVLGQLHSRPAPPAPVTLRRIGAIGLAACAAIGIVALITTSDAQFERDLPLIAMAATATYATDHPGDEILADELASALMWLHPETEGRIGFDTRLGQYSEEGLLSWFSYLNGVSPGWPGATDGYDVLLASAVDRPGLVERLSTLAGFSTLAAETKGAAFVRDGSR